jgi:AAA domain
MTAAMFEDVTQTAKPNGAAPRELDLIWADDIALDIDKPGLVDGLLSTTALTVAYGESGAGKTFVVIDLSCTIAAGLTWHDLGTEQGIVVYIAAEAPKSLERRVWAWKNYHGVEHLPLVVVRSAVNLLDGDTDTIIAELAEIKAKHGRIALVVIDTLARAMVGNENSPEDLGAFVAACARIRESAETSVLVVHHTGKDQAKGARGHSCLRAATDVELEITAGCIKVSKNRDGQEGQSYGFKLEQVELGTNRKGRMVTTCVALETDPPHGAGKKRKLGPNEQILFDALVKAIADKPDKPPPASEVPAHVQGVTVARWRATAMLLLPQDESKRKSEAFNRSLLSLVASGCVCHLAGFAWLP